MQPVISQLFAMMIALVGPAPADSPKELHVKPGDTIVAMGDSITAGGGYLRMMDAVFEQQYPDLKLPKVINKGISGHKAENLVARFDRDVLQIKPNILTINIGINDVWHRLNKPHDDAVLATYKENVGKMVDQAQAAGIKVVLVAPTVIKEDLAAEGNVRLKLYVAAMKEVGAKKKCPFVDLHSMFISAIQKKPADHQGNFLTGDGVHMRDNGNAIMAIGILRALGVPDEKIAATTWMPKAATKTTRPSK